MRKSAFIATIIAIVCAAAASCALLLFFRGRGEARGADATRRGNAAPLSIAQAAEPKGGEASGAIGGNEPNGAPSGLRPAFPLEEGEQALQILNADINLDGTYDQACAIRRGSEPEIYIVCAIQNPITTAYARLAPVKTAVTQRRTLLMYFSDVTGRQGNALVYSGMNSEGLQVLGICSLEEDETAASGFRLREILSLAADGAIQIEEVRRSEAYNMGMAAGASYPVVSYHSVPSDEMTGLASAQIRRTYAWNPLSGIYELSAESRVSAETAGAMVMQRLREGGDEALFRFFKGIWYKADSGAQGIQIGFDIASNEIIFADGQTQEVFEIESLSARRYGVYLVAHNSLISSIRRLVDIEITGSDEIQVRAPDDVRLRIAVDSSWDGTYRRMRGASSPAQPSARRIAQALEGADAGWSSSAGDLYSFEGGILAIESAGTEEKIELKYAIYMIGDEAVMQAKDASGGSAFYLLREGEGGQIAMQEAIALATEIKATSAAEITLSPVLAESAEGGGEQEAQ